jgi:hypothetical protein
LGEASMTTVSDPTCWTAKLDDQFGLLPLESVQPMPRCFGIDRFYDGDDVTPDLPLVRVVSVPLHGRPFTMYCLRE